VEPVTKQAERAERATHMGDTNIFHKLNKLKTNSGLKRKSFILL
jgi:hypothetical protein